MRLIITLLCIMVPFFVLGTGSPDTIQGLLSQYGENGVIRTSPNTTLDTLKTSDESEDDEGMHTPPNKFVPISNKKLKISPDIERYAEFQPEELLNRIRQLIQEEGIDPETMCAIFDVDGTLTTHKNPPRGPETAKPRETAIHFMQELKNMGILILISSAWDDFGRTVQTLDELGLKNIFCGDETQCSTRLSFDEEKFNVVSQGHVISVRKYDKKEVYYPNKFFASIVYAEKYGKAFPEYLMFFDDRKPMLNIFESDCLSAFLTCRTKLLITVQM